MRNLMLFVLCLVSFTTAAADDIGTLIRREHEWLRAAAAGDRAALDQLLHPDYVDVTAGGRIRSRDDVLAAAPLPPGVTQALQDLEVRVFGKTAVVTGVNVVRTGPTAMPIEVVFTDVYVRDHRTWRVVSAHHSVRRNANNASQTHPQQEKR